MNHKTRNAQVCEGCGITYKKFKSGLTQKDAHARLLDKDDAAGKPRKRHFFGECMGELSRMKQEAWANHTRDCLQRKIDKMEISKIYTHGNCNDGLGVFLLAKLYLPDVPVEMVHYGSTRHRNLPVEHGVVFADFSPHESQVEQWLFYEPIILDHHIHAKAVVEQFVHGVFNNDECGAMLFFKWLAARFDWAAQVPHQIQTFVSLIDLTDRYVVDHPLFPEARKLQATLGKLGYDMAKNMSIREIMEMTDKHGELLLAANRQSAADLVPKLRSLGFDMGQHTHALCGVGPLWLSGLTLEAVDESCGVVALFQLHTDLDANGHSVWKWQYSLRSKFVDVGAFCKAQGGGGHTLAAGYSAPAETKFFKFTHPVTDFYERFEDWMSTLRSGPHVPPAVIERM